MSTQRYSVLTPYVDLSMGFANEAFLVDTVITTQKTFTFCDSTTRRIFIRVALPNCGGIFELLSALTR